MNLLGKPRRIEKTTVLTFSPGKEAVFHYGPGTKQYQGAVWNLYQYGKEPNGGNDLF